MKDQHNIDRLFQESFKDFEVDAPKSAWKNIEKRLSQKSKTPIIPLWQKLSGAAAFIAVLILAGSQWLNTPSVLNPNNTVVDSPQENINNDVQPNLQPNNSVVNNSDFEDENSNNENSAENPSNSETALTSSENSNNNNLTTSENSNNNNSSLASNQRQNIQKNIPQFSSGKSPSIVLVFESKNIKQTRLRILSSPLENQFKKIKQPQQKSLLEVAQNIADNNFENSDKTKTSKKSWFVKPQISPVFYGNLGSGSAVDPSLAQNSGQGEVNMSYGVNVAYQLNDKIKLRTGVNRVNLNYTTNDVFLIPDAGLSSLSNINQSPQFNASVLTSQQIQNLSSSGNLGRIPTDQSQLQQELGFIEIPMELEYKILDQKIDINIIGGASTLLLNNNNIDVQSINGTTSIGEANNLNNLSFSTNLAIGFDYDISEKFMLNLEPTFKYQFNTFQSGTTDFQPYFLGIYSGVVFKF